MHATQVTRQAITPNGLLPTIMALSVAQAAIGQFVAHGVPLFLRAAEQPSHVIGLVYLASVPFILNVLWAPVIDRFRNRRVGHYRAWILFGHLSAFMIILGMSAADPASTPLLLIAFVLILAIVMATQDASLSGLMVRGLSPADRARGAAFRTAGAALAGTVVGALVIYLLADLGWRVVVMGLSVVAAASAALVLFLKLDQGWAPPQTRPSFLSQLSLFKRPEARRLMVVELFTGLGLAIPFGLKSILLIDAGFGVADAALLSLVAGGAVGLLAVLAIRPLIDRFGGYRVLVGVGIVTALNCCVYALIFRGEFGLWETAIYVLIGSALTFGAVPASRAILIAYCDAEKAATDFSAFNCVERVFLLMFGGLGVALADRVGFSALLLLAAAGSLFGSILAWRLRNHCDERHA